MLQDGEVVHNVNVSIHQPLMHPRMTPWIFQEILTFKDLQISYECCNDDQRTLTIFPRRSDTMAPAAGQDLVWPKVGYKAGNPTPMYSPKIF